MRLALAPIAALTVAALLPATPATAQSASAWTSFSKVGGLDGFVTNADGPAADARWDRGQFNLFFSSSFVANGDVTTLTTPNRGWDVAALVAGDADRSQYQFNAIGQLFTAPVTGVLASFTVTLSGGTGQLYGAVGIWDDAASTTSRLLYKSRTTLSGGEQAYTFAPDVRMTSGQRYVAYVSTYAPIDGAVPEPEGWATLTVGFGLVGASLRRRRAAFV